MILEEIASKYIKEICIKHLKKKYLENPVQRVLVNYFLGKEKIYSDKGELVYKGKIYLYVNKEAEYELNLDKEKILKDLEKEKYFLIDLSLYHLHSKKGKKSLEIQVSQSLKEIRDFLYDTNLILIGDLNFSFLGKNEVRIYKSKGDFPFERFKPLILDPYAEENLTEKDLKKYNLFLIGGIIDVGQKWERATEYLFRDLDFDRRKIALGESTKGVPDRINLIVRILLQCYYQKLDLRSAIIINQKKKDILERLWYEIKKYKRDSTISKEDLPKILSNVNITYEELLNFLNKHGIKIR